MAPTKCIKVTVSGCCPFQVGGSVFAVSLFAVAPIVNESFVFGPCFVM